MLRYGYDLPYAQIADALGSSEDAARAAASSGVRRLRRNHERHALISTALPRAGAPRGPRRRRATTSSIRRSATARRRDRPRPLPHLVRPARAASESLARPFGVRVLRAPLDDVRRELDEYFDGRRREFDLPLDLRVADVPRAGAARARPRAVRPARRPTAALAAKVGRPKAARAVGTVMNRNPIPIVLPCHRIVGANGSLTGYAGGLDTKLKLLQLEGAILA